MFNGQAIIGRRRSRAGWLPLVAAIVPFAAGADVIALFDEIGNRTVTPVGVTYPAVTPEETRTVFFTDIAAVHVAMYDAVVAIKGGYEPFSSVPTSPTAGASVNAAAAAAACGVLRGMFPNRAPQYEPACQSYIDALPNGTAKTRGLAVGSEVALGTLASRANDGRMASVTYAAGSDPGDFRGVNPALPFVPFMRPFAMTSASQFRADGPPDLTSFTYAKDLKEVQDFGSAASLVRTAAQTDLARFATEPPPFFWARNVRRFLNDNRSVLQNARLMAMLWVTQADALLACFDSKYHFDFWRPQSAITLADTDGNPATVADQAWTPVLPTPNHPEYPAAHACQSGAVGAVLERHFGGNKLKFSIDATVPDLLQPVRHYKEIDDMVTDLKLARIYGGMHYRTSTNDGALLARRVANWVAANYFRRNQN